MADDKVKILLENKVVLVGLIAFMAVLVAANLSNNAYAVTASDPAAKYNCYKVNAQGQFIHQNDTNGNPTDQLVPCDINTGDNSWMLTSSALVLMMTPAGLAIFYGGLSRQKNAVNTLHMVFITTGVIAVQYVLWGYSLAFGPDATGYGFIGTLDWAGLNNVLHDVPSDVYGGLGGPTIPHATYMVFQMMFGIITPALIVAALAERMKF